MFYALSKTLDLAFSPIFVALTLALLGALVARRGRTRLGRGLMVGAGLSLALLSTGAVAGALIDYTERFDGPRAAPDAHYDAVLLLGGYGARGPTRDFELTDASDRLMRAWELVREGRAARIVLAGGGDDPTETEADLAAALLERMGVPRTSLLLDRTSRNTRENALEIRKLVDRHALERLVLVTSAFHMQRSLECLHAVDLHPDALATDHRAPPWHGPLDAVAPRASHLATSELALRELAGRVVYRARGFTR